MGTGHSSGLTLMAIEPLPEGDWRVATLEAVRAAGLRAEPQGQGIVAWDDVLHTRGLAFADGWNLRRQWLGPRRHAVCLLPRRLYFAPGGEDLDPRQEREIVGGKRPAGPTAAEQIRRQWDVLSAVIDRLGPDIHQPVELELVRDDLASARVMVIGAQDRAEPIGSLGPVYRELGFDLVPDNFTVTLCCVDGVDGGVAHEFATKIRAAAQSMGTSLRVIPVTAGRISQRVYEMRDTGVRATPGRCLVFLLPPKSQPHGRETLDLLSTLEQAGVPFRRAYSDDPFQYSTAGQLASILAAAGGRPHRSPARVAVADIWTIGIDLGHPLGSTTSRLVMTLVDPDGTLVGAWFLHQQRDETARIDSLTRLLQPCQERLSQLAPDRQVLVLRDGRMLENERADVYAPYFEAGLTFVEFRKGNNPQMMGTDPLPCAPEQAIAAVVPETSTMLLTTLAPRDANKLPSVAKVVVRPEANGLGLALADIADILASSAAAPSLGLWPHHLPAAIYWADGIAGKSETDLRFWGTRAVCVD